MTTMDLHNQLLHDKIENGPRQLRSDFDFNDLFEPAPCICSACISLEPNWKFCPLCGRELKKENNDG